MPKEERLSIINSRNWLSQLSGEMLVMREATTSGIPELKSFVVGIERDYDAVKTALCLPWNQGKQMDL